MKAILEFTLPEEDAEHRLAVHAGEYASVIWDFNQVLRRLQKYESIAEQDPGGRCNNGCGEPAGMKYNGVNYCDTSCMISGFVDRLRDELHELMHAYGLTID